MLSQQKIVDQTVESISGMLREYAKTTAIDDSAQKALLVFLKATLTASLSAALRDTELHRVINTEMRQGLQNIYKTITSVADTADKEQSGAGEDTGKLFSEATEQLNEVMASTFEATETIMEEVEALQERSGKVMGLVNSGKIIGEANSIESLTGHITATDASLTQIMEALSFQDLTGQRLKKVMTALGQIQESIFEMYVSSGLMLKTGEEMPEKNVDEIKAESKRRLDEIKEIKGSELKGPSKGVTQGDVDSLLADLGF